MTKEEGNVLGRLRVPSAGAGCFGTALRRVQVVMARLAVVIPRSALCPAGSMLLLGVVGCAGSAPAAHGARSPSTAENSAPVPSTHLCSQAVGDWDPFDEPAGGASSPHFTQATP